LLQLRNNSYLAYQRLIIAPEEEATVKCCGTTNFQKLQMEFQSDSLYKLSLNGSEGKFGSKIADEYSGTDADLANYYAGIAI
jgi:hypothetical protein